MNGTLWAYADIDVVGRFQRCVYLGDADECWIWTGGIESDGGYGRFRPPGGAVIAAHRWSYLHHHGPTEWPVIRHRCDIRVCVNPAHLQAGTQAANITDTVHAGHGSPLRTPARPRGRHCRTRCATPPLPATARK